MRTGANILWFILGGWILALFWFIAAILMAISIVGIPWARACWEIGVLSLMPFGREVIKATELTGKSAGVLGPLRMIGNLIWLPLGVILAVCHVLHGTMMFCTIVGIPLAIQDFKLAGISLFPLGRRVVSIELANEARLANAREKLAGFRK